APFFSPVLTSVRTPATGVNSKPSQITPLPSPPPPTVQSMSLPSCPLKTCVFGYSFAARCQTDSVSVNPIAVSAPADHPLFLALILAIQRTRAEDGLSLSPGDEMATCSCRWRANAAG